MIETFARTYKAASVYGGSEEIMVDLGVRQAMKFYPEDARLQWCNRLLPIHRPKTLDCTCVHAKVVFTFK